jgi:hypothetical protein
VDLGIIQAKTMIRVIDGEVDLRIEVSANILTYSLWQVDFPILLIRPRGQDGNDTMVLPWMGGGVVRDPAHALVAANLNPEGSPRAPYTGFQAAMQFYAYYGSDGGMLFLHVLDGQVYPKNFVTEGTGSAIRFLVENIPVNNAIPGNDPTSPVTYASPYPCRIALMQGNWYDAAKRYRTWALQQVWASRGPIDKAPAFSPRLRQMDAGMFRGSPDLQNFDDFELYAEDAIRLKRLLGTSFIESLWFFWNTPRGLAAGAPAMRPLSTVNLGIRRAHAEGLPVAPYIGRVDSWDTGWPGFALNDAFRFVQRLPDGRPFIPTPDDGVIFVNVNPTYPEVQEIAAREVVQSVSFVPFDAMYIDVWSGGTTPIDHNRALPRSGGTNDWPQGRRKLSAALHDRVKQWDGKIYRRPEFAFFSEFPGEYLIDTVELVNPRVVFTAAGYPYTTFLPVPLYASVYHDYQAASDLISPALIQSETIEELFIAGLAVAYHFGMTMSFFSNSDVPLLKDPPESSPHQRFWRFYKTLVEANRSARKYQFLGERLRPLAGFPEDALDKPWLSPDPFVSASVWRSGEDIGVLLTNFAKSNRSVTVSLDRTRYPLPEAGLLCQTREKSRHFLGMVQDPVNQMIELPPDSATLLEIIALSPGVPVAACPEAEGAGSTEDGVVQVADLMVMETNGKTYPEGTPAYSQAVAADDQPSIQVQIIVPYIDGDDTRLIVQVQGTNDEENWQTVEGGVNISATGVYIFDVLPVLQRRVRVFYLLATDALVRRLAVFSTLVRRGRIG